jgi:guanosine-3',5'-bis(diphosphate) 3'-pyrophosphohydrolase
VRLFTRWHTWDAAQPELRGRLAPAVVDQLGAAVRFAAAWHGDQRRPTGAPYLEHLLEALEVLVTGAGVTSPDVLVAVILHDVVEDTPCTLDQVAAEFGATVARLVGWVTIPHAAGRGLGQDRGAVKEACLRRLAAAPRAARLVKLADRASNVQTLRNLPVARQRSYYAQTVTFVVPLAASEPWFAAWYAQWQADFADLAGPRMAQQRGGRSDDGRAAGPGHPVDGPERNGPPAPRIHPPALGEAGQPGPDRRG